MKYLNLSGLSYFTNKIKSAVADALDGKSDVGHTHTKSEITDFPSGLTVDTTLDGTSSNAISNSAVSNALDGKSDVGHTHTTSEISDFPSFGTSAGTICEGNDSRLSDARTPTSHTHTKSEITDFPSLATVATSGSYNDLSNKPTIPTTTSELTNDSGFITADYAIPRSGGAVLNGTNFSRTVNDSALYISGGATALNSGVLELYGKDHTSYAGYASLVAQDSSNRSQIVIKPTGSCVLIVNDTPKNIAMYEDVVPRSGGAVLTGPTLSRTVNDNELRLDGGPGWDNGASISLRGKEESSAGGAVIFYPSNDSSHRWMYLYPGGTWTWDGTACQITSDQRYKQQIAEIDDKLLDAWEDVDLVQFKYNDAVDQKGKDNARLHTGYVVQQIDEACQKHDVDISAYGLYCHEEYPQETEEVEVEQADGTKTKERKVIREASEHYSLRYTEVYAVECAYLRKKNKDLENTVLNLQTEIADLKSVIAELKTAVQEIVQE